MTAATVRAVDPAAIITAADLGQPPCDWELTLHDGDPTGYRCVLPADNHVGHIVRRPRPDQEPRA